MAANKVRTERFLFGEYTVPNTRFEIPAVRVTLEEVHSAMRSVSVHEIIGEMYTARAHKETLNNILKCYDKREQYGAGLTADQKETRERIRVVETEADRHHQRFNLFDHDPVIVFAAAMLSTWMRGSRWAKIEGIVPEIIQKVEAQMPISFYNAMSKTGPYESTVNAPDLGHVIHFGRLGKLMELPGGPSQIHIIDEYEYIGRRPDMFNGLRFDNTEYRKAVKFLIGDVAPISFEPHPEIKYDVYQENVRRFREDPESPEMVKKRAMFGRGMPLPSDDFLIPIVAYLEGSRPHPDGKLHTTLIERYGVLFLGMINGYAPIHGVPLTYPERVGVPETSSQERRLFMRTEILMEQDVFDLHKAFRGTGAAVSAIWTPQDAFLGYMLHNRNDPPTASTVRASLRDALRDKSTSANSGMHDGRYIVRKMADITPADKATIMERLPEGRQ